MALIDRITALWQRFQPEEQKTTSDELRPPARPSANINKFKAARDRKSIVKLVREMYDDDPRAKGVIQTLARDATMGGFQVAVSDGMQAEAAQEAANELLTRLNLEKRLDDWTRLTLRDGDTFLEPSVTDDRKVVMVTRKPTLQMHRNSNDADRFDDPTRAFWLADEIWAGQEPPADAVWFAQWQIIHARWDHDEGDRYGRPLFASSRKAYKRMDEGELDIAVRRKTRAGMKYIHTLPGASEPEIEAYKQRNKDALDEPFAAVADFFTNIEGGIDTVQGDARLAEIQDVVHHIRTWWLSSPVPMSLLGYGQDLNRDVLEEQKGQYDRALEQVASWVITQFVTPLLELQWLLLGIWPGDLEYSITPAAKETLTAEMVVTAAEAILKLKATRLFDEPTLLKMFTMLVPIDEELAAKALAALEAGRPDEIGRMADIATANDE